MSSKVRQVIELLFQIYNKEGELVPFKFNEIQARIDEEVIAPVEQALREQNYEELQQLLRNSILKYRQGGVTTLVMCWFLVVCMQRYAVCVMLTHDKEHSEKLLYRARMILKNLKGAQPSFSKLNDNEIAFEKTQSVFYIGTAGSKEFGRSATITYLHCSEIAFWKDPASLMKSLFQAVPKRTGVIVQETTANGWGNWFQKSYYNYMSSRGGFNARFYPWFIHEEYYSYSPFVWDQVTHDERKQERVLYKRIRRALPKLSRLDIEPKLQWRREKIDEAQGDQDRATAIFAVNQEYPSTIEEAFILTGGSLFGNVRMVETPLWQHVGNSTYALQGHPRAGYEYSLGADFSGGTGNDSSSINVLCVNTQEQVFEYANNRINPIDFSKLIVEVGNRYNTALLVPEVNAHGLAGTALLKKEYDLTRILKHAIFKSVTGSMINIPSSGYGWRTSGTSKPYMVGVAQRFVYHGWKLYGAITTDELRSFVEDAETGKMEGAGAHDDCAISFMLACLGVLKLIKFSGNNLEDLTEIEERLENAPATTPSAKVIEMKHRNDKGQYLVPWEDMFANKKRSFM